MLKTYWNSYSEEKVLASGALLNVLKKLGIKSCDKALRLNSLYSIMYEQKRMMADIERQIYGSFSIDHDQLGAQRISGLSEQLRNQRK